MLEDDAHRRSKLDGWMDACPAGSCVLGVLHSGKLCLSRPVAWRNKFMFSLDEIFGSRSRTCFPPDYIIVPPPDGSSIIIPKITRASVSKTLEISNCCNPKIISSKSFI